MEMKTQTTFRVIFRHPRGYTAQVKVIAASEEQAREIFAQRKPNATIKEVWT